MFLRTHLSPREITSSYKQNEQGREYMSYIMRGSGDKSKLFHTQLNNECLQTKHLRLSMETRHLRRQWENNDMHRSKSKTCTCTPTHTLREMTRTSTYCSVQSINSSHWAVSAPASMLFPVIHHVSTPLLSLTSCPPTWTQESQSSACVCVVTCDGQSSHLVTILLVLQAYTATHTFPVELLGRKSSSLLTHTYACTNKLPQVRAPCPAGAARGQAFVRTEGPRGGQRASQTHGGLWPSVFLIALSHFIIDFNSAMCPAKGKRGLYDPTTARTARCGRGPKTCSNERQGGSCSHEPVTHQQADLWSSCTGTVQF